MLWACAVGLHFTCVFEDMWFELVWVWTSGSGSPSAKDMVNVCLEAKWLSVHVFWYPPSGCCNIFPDSCRLHCFMLVYRQNNATGVISSSLHLWLFSSPFWHTLSVQEGFFLCCVSPAFKHVFCVWGGGATVLMLANKLNYDHLFHKWRAAFPLHPHSQPHSCL